MNVFAFNRSEFGDKLLCAYAEKSNLVVEVKLDLGVGGIFEGIPSFLIHAFRRVSKFVWIVCLVVLAFVVLDREFGLRLCL